MQYEFVTKYDDNVEVPYNVDLRLVAIKSAFCYRIKPIPTFIFREHSL